jgi:tetratricopeptide (TPR) repeat protein
VFYFKGISTATMADRYLYIPSLAAVIVVVAILAAVTPKHVLWAGWTVVAIFAMMSIARNRDWRDSEHLYATILEQDPEVGRIHINLSDILLQRGDDSNAARHLNRALEALNTGKYSIFFDDYYRIHIGLGAILARARRYPEAREHLETARKLFPEGEWSYLYMGGISLEADNDIPKAIEQFQTAIRLGPVNELARDYLGIAYFNQGRFEEAKAEFEAALKINSTSRDARAHLEMAKQALSQ